MSPVFEKYFQFVVIDKINEIISKQFQEMKDDLEARYNEIRDDVSGLKKLDSNYTDLRTDIENLKKQVSEYGQEIYGKMHEDIEGCETKVTGTIKTLEKGLNGSKRIDTLREELLTIKEDINVLLKVVVREDDFKKLEKELLTKIGKKVGATKKKTPAKKVAKK